MSTLAVSVDKVARRARLDPLDEDVQAAVEQAIEDAQGAVEGYLGRPIMPRGYTERGLLPGPDGGWQLINYPVQAVTAVTAETDPLTGQSTGYYTVSYTAGLDTANDPDLQPIRTFVEKAAAADPAITRLTRIREGNTGRIVQALTTEGQSVTYAAEQQAAADSGAPGAASVLTLKSLDRWRLAGRRVYQRPGGHRAPRPWPY